MNNSWFLVGFQTRSASAESKASSHVRVAKIDCLCALCGLIMLMCWWLTDCLCSVGLYSCVVCLKCIAMQAATKPVHYCLRFARIFLHLFSAFVSRLTRIRYFRLLLLCFISLIEFDLLSLLHFSDRKKLTVFPELSSVKTKPLTNSISTAIKSRHKFIDNSM